MLAEVKVIIFNKSSTFAEVTYSNWQEKTSKSLTIPPASIFETYNWREEDPNNPGEYIPAAENFLNLPIKETNNVITKIFLNDFAYDTNKITINLIKQNYEK